MGVATALWRRRDRGEQSTPRIAVTARWRPRIDPWGLLLVVAAVVISVTINARSGTAVLVVERSLPVGHVVSADDLRSAQVTITGQSLNLIAESDEASILGRVLAVPLVAGAPLLRDDLGRVGTLPPGEAVVSVPIGVKQLLSHVSPGDHVLVIDTGTAVLGSSAPAPAAGITVPATVVDVQMPSSDLGDTTAVVSLQLDRSAVQDVATAAAAGHISLALVSAAGS